MRKNFGSKGRFFSCGMSFISVICLRLLLLWERLRRHAGNCELLRSFFKSSKRINVRQGVS